MQTTPPPVRQAAASVRKPWGAAARLFGAPPPANSPALGRISTWRSVLGLATVLSLGRGDRSAVQTAQEEGWEKAVTTVVIALVVVPVAMLALRRATHPEFRPDLRGRKVLTRIALLVLTTFGVMAPIIWSVTRHGDLDPAPSLEAGRIVVGLVMVAYGLWAAFYVGWAAWWAVRSSCFVGEYHPMLGPVVTVVVVLATTSAELVQFDTKGVPVPGWLVLTFGGLATTLVLAAVEHRMLRGAGITWRTGPHPRPGGKIP